MTPGLVLLLFAPAPVVTVVVFGVFLLARRRGSSWAQASPLLGLEKADRQRIGAAVREGRPLTGQDGELARDAAQRQVRQRWFSYLFLHMAGLQLARVVRSVASSGLDSFPPLAAVAGGLLLAAALLGTREVRRARRYLTRHA